MLSCVNSSDLITCDDCQDSFSILHFACNPASVDSQEIDVTVFKLKSPFSNSVCNFVDSPFTEYIRLRQAAAAGHRGFVPVPALCHTLLRRHTSPTEPRVEAVHHHRRRAPASPRDSQRLPRCCWEGGFTQPPRGVKRVSRSQSRTHTALQETVCRLIFHYFHYQIYNTSEPTEIKCQWFWKWSERTQITWTQFTECSMFWNCTRKEEASKYEEPLDLLSPDA